MKHPEFSLKIKSPCPARWNEMIPDQKGRYCSSCSKYVIDFTKLTDAQVLEIITQSSGNICGRLRQDQVDRVIMVRNQQSLYSRLFTFFTGLYFLDQLNH